MAIKINNKATQLYLLGNESLKHGQIYEGSDGLLYVGVEVTGSTIIAVGINNEFHVDNSTGGENITFRTVTVEINYH